MRDRIFRFLTHLLQFLDLAISLATEQPWITDAFILITIISFRDFVQNVISLILDAGMGEPVPQENPPPRQRTNIPTYFGPNSDYDSQNIFPGIMSLMLPNLTRHIANDLYTPDQPSPPVITIIHDTAPPTEHEPPPPYSRSEPPPRYEGIDEIPTSSSPIDNIPAGFVFPEAAIFPRTRASITQRTTNSHENNTQATAASSAASSSSLVQPLQAIDVGEEDCEFHPGSHKQRDCPNKPTVYCELCGFPEHGIFGCNRNRMSHLKCKWCKAPGHVIRDCKKLQDNICPICCKKGHSERFCKDPPNDD